MILVELPILGGIGVAGRANGNIGRTRVAALPRKKRFCI